MGVGESSPCRGVAGEAGAAPREATSECLRRHPASVTPRALRAPAEGRVFTAEFLGYFICIHVIYNPNSETENINYMVDKFTQDVGPKLSTSSSSKSGSVTVLPAGRFCSQESACPLARATPQTARLPRLDRSSSFLYSGTRVTKERGDGDRNGWFIEQVPKGTSRQVPRGPGGKTRNTDTAAAARSRRRAPECGGDAGRLQPAPWPGRSPRFAPHPGLDCAAAFRRVCGL